MTSRLSLITAKHQLQAKSRSLQPFNSRLGVRVMTSAKKTKKPCQEHEVQENLDRDRDRALKRVLDVYQEGLDADYGALDQALDVLTVAHAKATFEYANNSFSS
jgi:hypothetical protein